ncbi:MAG: glycosyltransferase, partial [Armatimonadia bacterium]|nr:glycosyltransferase [Armatimonadia bacterium]
MARGGGPMTSSRPRVSACIVTWNSRRQICRCIDALLASEGPAPEIIVVDNASSDGTADLVREEYGDRVVLVANSENRYYAAGNNQAFERATGEHMLILNPDAYVEPSCMPRLLAGLDSAPDVAAVAPRLILPGGEVQRSCRRFPSPWWLFCEATMLRRLLPRTRMFGGYFYGEWSYDTERDVDQPMTSCLLVRGED